MGWKKQPLGQCDAIRNGNCTLAKPARERTASGRAHSTTTPCSAAEPGMPAGSSDSRGLGGGPGAAASVCGQSGHQHAGMNSCGVCL